MEEFLAVAAPVLARQHALITVSQIEDLGADRRLAARYVGRRIWERVDVGLYGPTGVPMTWPRRVLAAQLVAPRGTLVSHRAAAALLGVGGLSDPTPELSIPAGSRCRRTGVIAHESVDLHLANPQVVHGIPVTGPARLAMDVGAVMSERHYRQTMREIRHVLGVGNDELLRTYLRHKQQGRNGGGALRDWLDRYYAVTGVPESGLEQLALDAILDASLPRPELQWWVEIDGQRYRVDIAYPGHRLAIEVDGSQHVEDADIVCSDAVRIARLRRRGWTVIVVRSEHFASDLQRAIRTIRRHLAGSPVHPSAAG